MPTIPLLKPNLELAMPKVPALDHVPRPQIDARGVVNAMGELGRASQMPYIKSEPFVQVAGAKGLAMGKALSDAGDVLGNMAERVRYAIEKQQAHEQETAVRENRQAQAGAAGTAKNTAAYVAGVKKSWQQVEQNNQASKVLTPEQQERLKKQKATAINQGRMEGAELAANMQMKLTDQVMAANQASAVKFGDPDRGIEIAMDREEFGVAPHGEVERAVAMKNVMELNDFVESQPIQFTKFVAKGASGEVPEVVRNIPAAELPFYREKAQTVIAQMGADTVGKISAHINDGTLVSPSQLAFELPQYDPHRVIPQQDVAALMRKFQGDAAADPYDYVATSAAVANFDHGSEGDRGAANLRYRISVRHGGSYETRLLSEHEKQVERTKGASTMDEVDKTKARLFNKIVSNLPNGLFGNWLVRATRLYDDPESGLLMRAPFHGEHGDQPVKLSEKDAAAYAKAKAEGSEVPKSMMVEDLNLRDKAARLAMSVMSGLHSIAGSIKDGNPQTMIDRYAAMMKGPTMDLARRALLEAPESGYGVRPLSRMDRLVADPNAAWDAMEKTLIS